MKKGQGFGLVAVIVVLYAMFGGGERAQTSATVQPSATALTAPSTAPGSPPCVIAAPGLLDKAIAEPARVASIEPVLPTLKRPREGERTPKREEEKPQEVQPSKPSPAPALATAAIQKVLIAQSIANYSGSCACPYSTDRAERACGGRSAHSRRGGAAPLCFASDLTPAMVAAYREQVDAR